MKKKLLIWKLRIRDQCIRLLKYLGIENIGVEPKLWLEEIGEKTKLGVLGFSIIILFLYFFLLDIFTLVLTSGRQINLYPPIKNYILFTLSWQVIWWFLIYYMFYIKNTYLKTINMLFFNKKIIDQDWRRLKLKLLSPDIRNSIRFILFLAITFVYILQFFFTNKVILWGYISLEEIGSNNSDFALIIVLIYTILRWIGNIIQGIILADLFTMIFCLLSLGNDIKKILNVDLLNSDRRGGYGFVGILYFKIAVLYFISLTLFFLVTHDYPKNVPSLIGMGFYWIIIAILCLFAFFIFIMPQYSIHITLEKNKNQCIKNVMNKLNDLKIQDLNNHNNNSIYLLKIMLLLNEIDKMKTYSFSDRQLAIISLFPILISLFDTLLKYKDLL